MKEPRESGKTRQAIRNILYWHLLAEFPTVVGTKLRRAYFASLLDHMGNDVTIATGVKVLSPGKVQIGDRVGIASDVIIDGRGSIFIGSNTIVGFRSVILTSTHNFGRTDIPVRDQGMSCASVKIGSNVWIGANVYILPGVSIGDGAIVGACAVVTRNLPDNSISAGVPARVIRMRG